jgi:signal peptidase I
MGVMASVRQHRGIARATGLPLTCALFAVWFLLLRPLALGGPAEYVIVAGHSMEPTFLTGDLAVTQRQRAYAVGDIVAFKTSSGVVIHRIVGGDAVTGFITRGDNKPAADLWRPGPDSILGKVWFSIPGVGTALALVRQPAVLAAIAATVAFLLIFNSGPLRLPWSRRRAAARAPSVESAGTTP